MSQVHIENNLRTIFLLSYCINNLKLTMETYISILRGINVSGQRKILMTDLKEIYEQLNLKAVSTYIQSGNVLFKTEQKLTIQQLVGNIEQAIQKKYTFEVPVLIRTFTEMKKVLENNPFLKEPTIDIEKLYVTFIKEMPDRSNSEILKDIDFSPDWFIRIEREIFLYCPGGYGNTKLTNNLFERKMKTNATTRNWKTVKKLVELASAL